MQEDRIGSQGRQQTVVLDEEEEEEEEEVEKKKNVIFIVVPWILITSKFFSPTNALFVWLIKRCICW